MTVLIGISLAQGAIGYIQYFTRLPAGLVEVHVLGATLVWVAVLWVRAATWLPALERAVGTSPAVGPRPRAGITKRLALRGNDEGLLPANVQRRWPGRGSPSTA